MIKSEDATIVRKLRMELHQQLADIDCVSVAQQSLVQTLLVFGGKFGWFTPLPNDLVK